MKLSVSIPDDLWRQNAEPGDSASQVIQSALAERARRRELEAQREAVPEYLRNQISNDATARLLYQAKVSFELGYKCGGAALDLLEWPDVEGFVPTTDPLEYLETTFVRRMEAIQQQRGPTSGTNPQAAEENENALNFREGALIGQLAAVVDAWSSILLSDVERDGPVTEAEFAAEVAAREGIESVTMGDTPDSALDPYRDWLTEINVGYRTWAKGFSRAIDDARTVVLTDAHLTPDADR